MEVQCSEEGIELQESFVEVGSDEFQVRCLVARLASLSLTVSLTVRRLFPHGSRLASLLLQAALLCLLLSFLMPLLFDDGGLQEALHERALRANAVQSVTRRDKVVEDVGRGPLVQQCHIRQAAIHRG